MGFIGDAMRVLYIHQYFVSRKGHSSTRSYEFARYLASKGHEVIMLTSGVGSVEFGSTQGSYVNEYAIDGIKVISLNAGYNDPRHGTTIGGLKRLWYFYQFAWVATVVSRRLKQPDVIFATQPPLMIGIAADAISRHFRRPFVFEVRDLWPEALVNIGALRNPVLIWWLRRMAKRIYRRAEHIVALSPGIRTGVGQYGIDRQKISMIPNASDLDLFYPRYSSGAFRKKLRLEGKFVAIYFGAMGLANGLEYVIEAAKSLSARKRDDVVVILHGDGGAKRDLESMVDKLELRNVLFSSLLPEKEAVAEIVAECDACLTIYRASVEESWSPNKLFDALAAGKPIVINVAGWLGRLVEEAGCGFSTRAEHPCDLADALEKLADSPELRDRMGMRARALAEERFDRQVLAGELERVLAAAVR